MRKYAFHLLLLGCIFLGLIIRFIASSYLIDFHSALSQPFFSQLLNFSFTLPFFFYMLIAVVNTCLFFLIGRSVSKVVALFSAFVYAISSWFVYTDISGSLYSLGLAFILCSLLVFLYKDKKYKFLGIGGGLLLSYFFLFGFLYLLFLIFYFRKERQFLLYSIVGFIPLILICLLNLEGVKNIYSQEVLLFKDVGIINAVNTFQGNLYESGWGGFGKLLLNKFSYYFLIVADSFLSLLSLVTYFTAEKKLFGFSNLSPLSFSLIIPFFIGAIILIKKNSHYQFIIGFIILSAGALLSDKSMRLEKLLLISPVIVLIISFGFQKMLLQKNKYVLSVFWILFVMSTVILLSDLVLYEKIRMGLMQR